MAFGVMGFVKPLSNESHETSSKYDFVSLRLRPPQRSNMRITDSLDDLTDLNKTATSVTRILIVSTAFVSLVDASDRACGSFALNARYPVLF